MNQKNRLIILALTFIGATGFFFWLINGVIYNIRAAGDKVKISFEKTTYTARAGETVPVDVMVAMPDPINNRFSAGIVTLRYTTRTLEFVQDDGAQVDVVCSGKDFSLKTLLAVAHDKNAGTVSLSRVVIDPDNTKLPPHLADGVSCFSTFYFKTRSTPAGTFNPVGRISFVRDAEACEFVGPVDKTYACEFAEGASVAAVRINQTGSPIPTKKPIDPGKECGRCGTTSRIECESELICLQSNQPDSEGVCVKPDGSSSCTEGDSAFLTFDPLTVVSNPNKTFSVDVIIDAGKHKIFSTDFRSKFNPEKLEVVEIKDGNYFSIPFKTFQNLNSPPPKCPVGVNENNSYDLNHDGIVNAGDYATAMQNDTTSQSTYISQLIENIKNSCPNPELSKPGNIYVAGIGVSHTDNTKTGRGVLATIVFRSRSAGPSNLSIVCQPGETATDSNIAGSIDQYNVIDVIDCKANGQAQIRVAGGGGACPRKAQGDCNCDDVVDIVDFEPWRAEKAGESQTKKCDYDGNGTVGVPDYNIWRTNFFFDRKPTPIVIAKPTIGLTISPKPTNIATDSSTINLTPTVLPTAQPNSQIITPTTAPTVTIINQTP